MTTKEDTAWVRDRRKELELEVQYLDISERFIRAKAKGDRESEEFLAARKALTEFRALWRGIRDYLRAKSLEDNPDISDDEKELLAALQAQAAPAPLSTSAKVRNAS